MKTNSNKRLMLAQQVGLGQLLAATSLQNAHNCPIGGRYSALALQLVGQYR
ncbi:hypothetical protein [Paraglaciecola sp. 25GB23A]|uniref:hypothetical protein n=1 Tax=Paraglaciecola sp. 25GB23A TaxID=3156068 RepID=UPI0032AF0CCB